MKKDVYNNFLMVLSFIRLIPHWIIFNFNKNRKTIWYEVDRWLKLSRINRNRQAGFIYLMTFYPEFRNLFYYRIGGVSGFINFLCPKMSTLYIHCAQIGPGLFIQHGFATIIAAKSVGKDCWINQQVTIGFANDTDSPIIQDNVKIGAGAKVIGNVIVGNNSKVGANAVVVKDVPENCTVVGVPAYIIKKDGINVSRK